MEMEEVLNALETLKKELNGVAQAGKSVEKTVAAAQSLCDAFRDSADKMTSFRANLTGIEETVAAVKRDLGALVPGFDEKVSNTCRKLEKDVGEFHEELESFDKKFARTAGRVDEQVKSLSESLATGLQTVRTDVKEGVGLMVRTSKDAEIISAVSSVSSDVSSLSTSTTEQARSATEKFERLNQQVDSVEKTVGKGDEALSGEVALVRAKQEAMGKLVVLVLVLGVLQLLGLVALALKVFA